MMTLETTALGYPLPHPENPAKTVDVPRLRAAILMIDEHVEALQLSSNALASDKADKVQVAIDIAAAVSQAISDLLDGAPEAYDTLVEIAAKLTDNDDVVAGILSTLALKANAADVTTALGFKADAAAMTDALALKADKTTVADQLADKASHDQVKAEVQTVSPIGNIVHAAAAPDETYLPLDGSKYLRSAYPDIAPMFAGTPRGATVTTLTDPAGLTLAQPIVAGGYILAIELNVGTQRIFRAPVTTVNGGSDFIQVSTISGARVAVLLKAKSGRLAAFIGPTTSTLGSFRYSDDDGQNWSAAYTIPMQTFNDPEVLVHAGNTMLFAGTSGILRVDNNVAPSAVVSGSSGIGRWIDHLGDLVGLQGVYNIARYSTATGALNSAWRSLLGSTASRIFSLDGDIVVVSVVGMQTLTVYRLVERRVAVEPVSFEVISSINYSVASLLSGAVTGSDGSELMLLALMTQNSGNTSQQLELVFFAGGQITSVTVGPPSASINGQKIAASGSVVTCALDSSLTQKRRLVLDTNPETEFRLPNRPNHFIKASS